MVSPTASSSDLVGRVVRVLRLDRSVFEDVEGDSSATSQAWTIVIISAISTGLAGLLQELVAGPRFGNPVIGLVYGVVSGLIGFIIWAFVVYVVGTRLFGGTATLSEMIRTLGFAYSPNIFGILAGIPVLGGLIAFVLTIWSIIAGYFAVRVGLNLDTGKAVFTMVISFVVLIVIVSIITAVFGAIAIALGLGATLTGLGAP